MDKLFSAHGGKTNLAATNKIPLCAEKKILLHKLKFRYKRKKEYSSTYTENSVRQIYKTIKPPSTDPRIRCP